MINDILTMAWKEWREFRDQLFRFKRGGLSALISVLILGVVTPIQMGREWLTSPLMYVYWPILSSSMVSTLIADSIAGERERHTLETLLASRLPDLSILLGKVLAAVLYGCFFAGVNLVTGVIVVNIKNFAEAPLFMPGRQALQVVALVTLMCAFFAGLGVFVSMKAKTVRQAQQTFGIVMVLMFILPALVVPALSVSRRGSLATLLLGIGMDRAISYVIAFLAVATVAVNVGASMRFRRGQLALD